MEDRRNASAVKAVVEATASAKELFLSDSMRTHASRICCRALRAARTGLDGNRGHCELLTGARGQGKTEFLLFLKEALSRLVDEDGDSGDDGDTDDDSDSDDDDDDSDDDSDNHDHSGGNGCRRPVRAIHIDLSTDASTHPLTLLAEAAGVTLAAKHLALDGIRAGLQHIHDALVAAKACVVLLVDEYHTVYTSTILAHQLWRTALYCIPNTRFEGDRNMRVFAVLTGSSAWTHSLAFGQARRDPDRFPLYEGAKQNLNTQRYISRDFAALSSVQDVAGFLKYKHGVEPDDETVDQSFFLTGGNIGRMASAREGTQGLPYATTGNFLDTHLDLLQLLRKASEQCQIDTGDGPNKTFPWFLDTPVRYLTEVNGGEAVPAQRLYEAADSGAIVFYDEQQRVRFATPALASRVANLSATAVP